MINAAIFGSTGYAGAELIKLLINHPKVNLKKIVSRSNTDELFTDLYHNLLGSIDLKFSDESLDEVVASGEVDVIFLALPHCLTNELIKDEYFNSVKIIDLSGDFRLDLESDYSAWYNTEHKNPALLKNAAYGLPEINKEINENTNFVANPGCFPTVSVLSLAPLLSEGLIEKDSIIVDAKSGVSGAGRRASIGVHFNEVNESIKAYKVLEHRHTVEIEQEASKLANEKQKVIFTPHLVPMNKGILATAYAKLKSDRDNLTELYKEYYKDAYFVRVKADTSKVETKWVRNSNFVDVAIKYDRASKRVVATAAIDNLFKGASGQAIQNMNLMFGFDEKLGIDLLPSFPA